MELVSHCDRVVYPWMVVVTYSSTFFRRHGEESGLRRDGDSLGEIASRCYRRNLAFDIRVCGCFCFSVFPQYDDPEETSSVGTHKIKISSACTVAKCGHLSTWTILHMLEAICTSHYLLAVLRSTAGRLVFLSCCDSSSLSCCTVRSMLFTRRVRVGLALIQDPSIL
jgi:hypothetical protein